MLCCMTDVLSFFFFLLSILCPYPTQGVLFTDFTTSEPQGLRHISFSQSNKDNDACQKPDLLFRPFHSLNDTCQNCTADVTPPPSFCPVTISSFNDFSYATCHVQTSSQDHETAVKRHSRLYTTVHNSNNHSSLKDFSSVTCPAFHANDYQKLCNLRSLPGKKHLLNDSSHERDSVPGSIFSSGLNSFRKNGVLLFDTIFGRAGGHLKRITRLFSINMSRYKRILVWLWTGNLADLQFETKTLVKTKVNDWVYKNRVVTGSNFPDSVHHKYDFAAYDSGARIIANSPSIKNVRAPQHHGSDNYLIAPCSQSIWFVMAFSTTVHIESIGLVSQEFFSSVFHSVEILGSSVYPTDHWRLLAVLRADFDRPKEWFNLVPVCEKLEPSACWVRYIKFKVVDYYRINHYGYCTLNRFQVFGTDLLESLDMRPSDAAKASYDLEETRHQFTPSKSTPSYIKESPKALILPHINRLSSSGSSTNIVIYNDLDQPKLSPYPLSDQETSSPLMANDITLEFNSIKTQQGFYISGESALCPFHDRNKCFLKILIKNTQQSNAVLQPTPTLSNTTCDIPSRVSSQNLKQPIESRFHDTSLQLSNNVVSTSFASSSSPAFSSYPGSSCQETYYESPLHNSASLNDTSSIFPSNVSRSTYTAPTPPFLLTLVDRVDSLETTVGKLKNLTLDLAKKYPTFHTQLTELHRKAVEESFSQMMLNVQQFYSLFDATPLINLFCFLIKEIPLLDEEENSTSPKHPFLNVDRSSCSTLFDLFLKSLGNNWTHRPDSTDPCVVLPRLMMSQVFWETSLNQTLPSPETLSKLRLKCMLFQLQSSTWLGRISTQLYRQVIKVSSWIGIPSFRVFLGQWPSWSKAAWGSNIKFPLLVLKKISHVIHRTFLKGDVPEASVFFTNTCQHLVNGCRVNMTQERVWESQKHSSKPHRGEGTLFFGSFECSLVKFSTVFASSLWDVFHVCSGVSIRVCKAPWRWLGHLSMWSKRTLDGPSSFFYSTLCVGLTVLEHLSFIHVVLLLVMYRLAQIQRWFNSLPKSQGTNTPRPLFPCVVQPTGSLLVSDVDLFQKSRLLKRRHSR